MSLRLRSQRRSEKARWRSQIEPSMSLDRRNAIKLLAGGLTGLGLRSVQRVTESTLAATIPNATSSQSLPKGPFAPTWESVRQNYKVPRWFRAAKFGIFIHWG